MKETDIGTVNPHMSTFKLPSGEKIEAVNRTHLEKLLLASGMPAHHAYDLSLHATMYEMKRLA